MLITMIEYFIIKMNFSYNKGEGNDRLDHTLNQKRGKNYEDVLETKRRTINIIGSGGSFTGPELEGFLCTFVA